MKRYTCFSINLLAILSYNASLPAMYEIEPASFNPNQLALEASARAIYSGPSRAVQNNQTQASNSDSVSEPHVYPKPSLEAEKERRKALDRYVQFLTIQFHRKETEEFHNCAEAIFTQVSEKGLSFQSANVALQKLLDDSKALQKEAHERAEQAIKESQT